MGPSSPRVGPRGSRVWGRVHAGWGPRNGARRGPGRRALSRGWGCQRPRPLGPALGSVGLGSGQGSAVASALPGPPSPDLPHPHPDSHPRWVPLRKALTTAVRSPLLGRSVPAPTYGSTQEPLPPGEQRGGLAGEGGGGCGAEVARPRATGNDLGKVPTTAPRPPCCKHPHPAGWGRACGA